MTGYKVIALTLAFVMLFVIALPSVVSASIIGDAIKALGIASVVRTFGGQINTFINNLTGQRGIEWEGTTKVVPIVSVGAGTAVGAAQVQGASSQVDQVRAVGQLEARVGDFRGRLLVPVNTSTPSENMTRVKGVGVSALVDFRL